MLCKSTHLSFLEYESHELSSGEVGEFIICPRRVEDEVMQATDFNSDQWNANNQII